MIANLPEEFEAITGETDTNLSNVYLRLAASRILDKCYPFGNREGLTVPEKYVNTQLELAVVLYFKRGAEGEKVHNENGVSRTYESEDDLLKRITPHVGVVG